MFLCSNWFHLKCTDLNKIQFDAINGVDSLQWFCAVCMKSEKTDTMKISDTIRQMKTNIFDSFKLLETKFNLVSETANSMKNLQNQIENFSNSKQGCVATYSSIVTKNQKIVISQFRNHVM